MGGYLKPPAMPVDIYMISEEIVYEVAGSRLISVNSARTSAPTS